jgi:hypothetical protein
MGFDVAADSAALFVIRLAFEGLPTSGFPLSVRLSLGLSPANHRDLLTPDDPLYLAQGCLDSLSFEFFFCKYRILQSTYHGLDRYLLRK